MRNSTETVVTDEVGGVGGVVRGGGVVGLTVGNVSDVEGAEVGLVLGLVLGAGVGLNVGLPGADGVRGAVEGVAEGVREGTR
jgi:hypothetical protein